MSKMLSRVCSWPLAGLHGADLGRARGGGGGAGPGLTGRCRTGIFLLLVAAAFLLVGAALAQWPPWPTPTPSAAFLQVRADYYDLDGRAGLVPSGSYPTTGTTEIFTPVQDSSDYVGYFGVYPLSYEFTPFTFAITIPGVGYYEGQGIFEPNIYPEGTWLKYYVIPITSEELGTTMTLASSGLSDPPPPNGQAIVLRIFPMFDNGCTRASYAVDVHASPARVLDAAVSVEYLSGCALYPLGGHKMQLALRNKVTLDDYYSLLLIWSGYTFPTPPPYEWDYVGDAPAGPVTISLGMDGYATDTIRLDLQNLREYHWYPLLHPLVDHPEVFRPTGLSFSRAIPPRLYPVMEEIKEAILHSLSTTDQNGDGAIDIGDMIDLVNEVP